MSETTTDRGGREGEALPRDHAAPIPVRRCRYDVPAAALRQAASTVRRKLLTGESPCVIA
jgi:hypothetical protein